MTDDPLALGQEETLRRIRGWSVRFASRFLPEEEVHDAAQLAVIECWKTWPRLSEFDSPWSVLIVCARRGVFSHSRSLSRRSVREAWYGLTSDAALLDPTPSPDMPEALAESSYIATRVRSAVATLPRAEQAAVTLVDLQGLEPGEAATSLGLSPKAGAIRAARRRAYQRLRPLLADLAA